MASAPPNYGRIGTKTTWDPYVSDKITNDTPEGLEASLVEITTPSTDKPRQPAGLPPIGLFIRDSSLGVLEVCKILREQYRFRPF